MKQNTMSLWEFYELSQEIKDDLIDDCIEHKKALEQTFENLLNSKCVKDSVCLDQSDREGSLDKLKLFIDMIASLGGKYTEDKYIISVDENYKEYKQK